MGEELENTVREFGGAVINVKLGGNKTTFEVYIQEPTGKAYFSLDGCVHLNNRNYVVGEGVFRARPIEPNTSQRYDVHLTSLKVYQDAKTIGVSSGLLFEYFGKQAP